MHRQTERPAGETVRNGLRVVYIMGYGRSGSTVLDTILGNHARVESVGELAHVVRAAWLGDEYCACGVRGSECPFWSAVRARWEALGGDAERYAALQERVEGGRGPIVRLLTGLAPTGRAFEAWGTATRDLLAAIAAESKKDVLVDSSKNPARALGLSRVPGIDLFAVHLVRDGRGVAWSLAKPLAPDTRGGVQEELRSRSVTRTAVAWSLVNRAADRVLASRPADRRLLLRYEDYVADLAGALRPLDEFLGGGLADLADGVTAGERLDPGHTVAGNRLRMRGNIELRPDVEWRERMSPRQRARVRRLAGASLRRYGYAE